MGENSLLLDSANGSRCLFLGPPFEEGPLPAVFYFALSAKDSLYQDPFNQPAQALAHLRLRVFSLTLPYHDLAPDIALRHWADDLEHGIDPITPFAKQVALQIETLIQKEVILKDKIGVMGLSRGAFIAAHVAANCPAVSTLLGFAPLTQLEKGKDFSHLAANPLTFSLRLEALAPLLAPLNVRFYSGNHDTRVSTSACTSFILKLSEEAYAQKIRSSPIELRLSASIGHQGHGTAPEIFQEGALWIAEKLGFKK